MDTLIFSSSLHHHYHYHCCYRDQIHNNCWTTNSKIPKFKKWYTHKVTQTPTIDEYFLVIKKKFLRHQQEEKKNKRTTNNQQSSLIKCQKSTEFRNKKKIFKPILIVFKAFSNSASLFIQSSLIIRSFVCGV